MHKFPIARRAARAQVPLFRAFASSTDRPQPSFGSRGEDPTSLPPVPVGPQALAQYLPLPTILQADAQARVAAQGARKRMENGRPEAENDHAGVRSGLGAKTSRSKPADGEALEEAGEQGLDLSQLAYQDSAYAQWQKTTQLHVSGLFKNTERREIEAVLSHRCIVLDVFMLASQDDKQAFATYMDARSADAALLHSQKEDIVVRKVPLRLGKHDKPNIGWIYGGI
jgi:hypothetical protein